MMNNKRGHIATTLLFFGALVLVAVTLFSFVSFSDDIDDVGKEFEDLSKAGFSEDYVRYLFDDMVKKANEDIDLDPSVENENFEDEFMKSFEKIALERNLDDGISDVLFDKIEKGEYDVNLERVEIKGLEFVIEAGNHVVRRKVDLKFIF
jgi:hypothetical protein